MLQVHGLADQPSAGATDHPIARGPRTARAVLRLLALLARTDGPLRADEAAAELGKSLSTTYALLDALCAEGFAVHARGGFLLADPGRAAALAQQETSPANLAAAVAELHERTGKRAYLATARSGQVVIAITHGRQGVPRIPGLQAEIADDAHALALGKIALSLLPERGLQRYIDRGLKRFTPATIVDPDALRAHLAVVRRTGLAHDREEYHADFCCLAVGVQDGRRRTVAALGISMSAHAYDVERDALVPTLRDVAARAIPALPEKPEAS
jgi:DNA-binding IclR family transcriptional regulator